MRQTLHTAVILAASVSTLVPAFEAESYFVDQTQERDPQASVYDIGATVVALEHPTVETIHVDPIVISDSKETYKYEQIQQTSEDAERPEAVPVAFYTAIIEPINDSVPSYKLYDIDPAIVQEAILVLIKDGFTIQGAAATVGALMTESRLDPAVSNGHGIAQWQGARRRNVNPLPTDTLEEQLQKMLTEMKQSYIGVYADMRDPQASLDQTIKAMHRYEGESIVGKRKILAKNLFELLQIGLQNALQN